MVDLPFLLQKVANMNLYNDLTLNRACNR